MTTPLSDEDALRKRLISLERTVADQARCYNEAEMFWVRENDALRKWIKEASRLIRDLYANPLGIEHDRFDALLTSPILETAP
jgi:hypothetical protein